MPPNQRRSAFGLQQRLDQRRRRKLGVAGADQCLDFRRQRNLLQRAGEDAAARAKQVLL